MIAIGSKLAVKGFTDTVTHIRPAYGSFVVELTTEPGASGIGFYRWLPAETIAIHLARGDWTPLGSAHERLELLAWARDLAARSPTLDQVLAEMEEMDA